MTADVYDKATALLEQIRELRQTERTIRKAAQRPEDAEFELFRQIAFELIQEKLSKLNFEFEIL